MRTAQISQPADVRDNLQQLQRVFRKNDLPAFVGLRRTAIDKLVKEGRFPKPIPLNEAGNAVVWLESDLIAWQQRLIAARDAA